jgi:hypothetical protein
VIAPSPAAGILLNQVRVGKRLRAARDPPRRPCAVEAILAGRS